MTQVPLHEAAIEAALKQDWTNAISINRQVLESDSQNTDAMNRLGFAYLKIGKCKEAKKIFSKVISIDPYNKIAAKNLSKLDDIHEDAGMPVSDTSSISPLLFIEDPGKTKIAKCIHNAPQKVLSMLHCGQEVYLRSKNHGIEIRDDKQRYLAALPDDISFRLLKMITANNKYRVFIKSVDKNSLTVLVRETARGKKYAHQPSFLSISSYQPLTRELTTETDKPDTSATGEDETEIDNT